MKKLSSSIVVAMLAPLVALHADAQEPLTRTGARRTMVVTAVERTKDAVVNIHSERPGANQGRPIAGMGTGIVIDERGWIVTNDHVIDEVITLRCVLSDGSSHKAVILARDSALDLAIIRIDAKRSLKTMPLGTAADLMLGETVIAIGNAYGYEHSVSVGVISARKRDVTLHQEMKYKGLIQTDAAVNPGNSGGPLINIHGELIGVNVAVRDKAQNIAFAIPVEQMVLSVQQMLRSRRPGYDGITVKDRLDDSGDGLVRVVEVENVDSNSPASKAGLDLGDVILSVGDMPITCSYDVERALFDRKTGDKVALALRRQEKKGTVHVVMSSTELLAALARKGSTSKSTPLADADGELIWKKLGLRLKPTDLDEKVHRLKSGMEVTEVGKQGLAAGSGIRKGDILIGLDKWETTSSGNVVFVLNHPQIKEFSPLVFYVIRDGAVRKGTLTAEAPPAPRPMVAPAIENAPPVIVPPSPR